MYCERQQGNLCRMHSINNYYQSKKLTQQEFYNYCNQYDQLYKTTNSQNADMFNEGRNVVGFILEKISNDFTLLLYQKDIQIIKPYLNQITDIFCFNSGHIWIRKKIHNQWFNLDSLSGAHKIANPLQPTLGYMVVIPNSLKPQMENLFINQIKQSKIYNHKSPEIYYKTNLLDDAEIPLSNLYHLTKKYKTVNEVIETFRISKLNPLIPKKIKYCF